GRKAAAAPEIDDEVGPALVDAGVAAQHVRQRGRRRRPHAVVQIRIAAEPSRVGLEIHGAHATCSTNWLTTVHHGVTVLFNQSVDKKEGRERWKQPPKPSSFRGCSPPSPTPPGGTSWPALPPATPP